MAQAQDTLSDPRVDLSDYFDSIGLDPLRASSADVVLALLRINTAESLEVASEIVGRPITVCPPAIPPWPPKPVNESARKAQRDADKTSRVVTKVGRNPCLPTTGAFQRFHHVRVGMTEDQLLRRGLTRRDLRVWAKKGAIALEEKTA